jgi:hypothetical protein
MALAFFEDASSGSQYKPFLEAYLELHPEAVGSVHEVTELSLTRRKAGYMLNTEQFSVYVRVGNKTLAYLLQALELWIEDMHGYGVYLEVTGEHPYYRLAVDSEEERNWLHTKGKYSQLVDSISTSVRGISTSDNPFLVPSPITLATRTRSTRKPKEEKQT